VMRTAVGVGVLASLLPCLSGCSFISIQEPPVLTPTTTDVSCTTTRVPVVVDGIVAVSFLLGIGVSAYQHDNGEISGSGLAASVALGLALTSAFLASANVGINRTQACRETIAKLHRRDLRQAREREAQARRAPSPLAPVAPVTDPVATPGRADAGTDAGTDTQ
jgi:hypothetical protein